MRAASLVTIQRQVFPFVGWPITVVGADHCCDKNDDLEMRACKALGVTLREKQWPFAEDAEKTVGVAWDDDRVAVRTWKRLCIGPRKDWDNIINGGGLDYGSLIENRVLKQGGWVGICADGSVMQGYPRFVLPGSFNPLHQGHIGLGDACSDSTVYELSLVNVDKPPMTVDEALRRCAQFAGLATLILSSAPTFAQKAHLLSSPTRDPLTFCIGFDTAQRLPLGKYYEGGVTPDPSVLFGGDHVRFLVAPRGGFHSCSSIEPESWRRLMTMVQDFSCDVSSTAIRGGGK